MPGTFCVSIRGDYSAHTRLNLLHVSDIPPGAEREIRLFFKPEAIYPWTDGNEE